MAATTVRVAIDQKGVVVLIVIVFLLVAGFTINSIFDDSK